MKKAENVMHAMAAFFMPAIPMLYLYARNSDYLPFVLVVYFTIALCVASLLGYAAVHRICRSHFVGLLFCLMLWLAFFSFKDILVLIRNVGGKLRNRYELMIVLLLLFGLTAAFAKLFWKRSMRPLCIFIDITAAILLVWNGVSVMSLASRPVLREDLSNAAFSVEENLPSPNVYWLHCDGMLSFGAMERYFDDSQSIFADSLESRGFAINREAKFEAAHTTVVAIPALMCPDYYDNYLAPLLKTLRDTHQTALSRSKMGAALSTRTLSEARKKNELVQAFQLKGYSLAAIDTGFAYFFPRMELFVNTAEAKQMILNMRSESDIVDILIYGQIRDFFELLHGNTMFSALNPPLRAWCQNLFYRIALPGATMDSPVAEIDVEKYIPSSEKRINEKNLIIGLNESFSLSSPRIVIGMISIAHYPFDIDENGHSFKGVKYNFDAHAYPPQHRYAAKYITSVVDFILENDPEAIIVLQADHGLHGLKAQEIMEQFSVPEDDVWDIWNSTMSAVRIPEKYGVLTEPLHPLNISRYLVNHYVGDNYAYLEPGAEEETWQPPKEAK